ncbi:MAG: phosphatidate cytidylyltransferase [Vicinamibacterales bacterium]
MTRVLSGVVLGAVFLAVIWFAGTLVLLGVALVVAGLAFQEYAGLARALDIRLPLAPAAVATVAVVAVMVYPRVPVAAVLSAAVMASAVAVMASGRTGAATMGDMAAGLLAPVYLGLPLGALVALHQARGREVVLLLIATVVVSDSGQYYAGRLLGRTPLAPRLSPKKTREGAVGGFVLAPAFLAGAGWYVLPSVSTVALVVLGLAVVAAGIAGDLFESMLKRAANMKDSSSLIPGHGGVLDRIDALLFATPVFYFVLQAL